MKHPVLLFIYILFSLPLVVVGQQNGVKSIEELINLAEQKKSEAPTLSKNLFLEARAMSLALGEVRHLGKIDISLTSCYLRNQVLDSAELYASEAILYLPEDDKLQAEAYISLGSIAYYRNNLAQAMDYFIKALKIADKISDNTSRARVLNNLGAISEAQQNFEQAFTYYQQSYEIKREQLDSLGMARSLNNMGSSSIPLKRYLNAVEYLLTSIEIKHKLNETRGLAPSYANLGIAYKELGDYDKAIVYHRKNMEEDRKLGQLNDLFYGYNNIAIVYAKQNNLAMAQSMADSAVYYVKTSGNIKNYMEAYNTLYQLAEQKGDKAKAFDYFKKYNEYKDSVMNLEKNRTIEDLRTAYETGKKEQTIKDLEQVALIKDLQAETDKQWRVFLWSLAGFLTLTAGLFFNRYRLKQKTSAALDEKNAELTELNRLKDRMFAVISHDLRSPLSAFKTLTENLAINLHHIKKEDLEQYLQQLNRSSHDLYNMLNNLLEWAIAQTGSFPFQPEKFSLSEVAAQIERQLALSAEVRKIVLKIEMPTTLHVHADKGMVSIVMRNLIANAIKFSTENTDVLLTAFNQDGKVAVTVTDYGLGMNDEEIKKLFTTSANVRSIGTADKKGSGIGLFLCKEFVERNGGNIGVESEPGRGSKFYFTLPAA